MKNNYNKHIILFYLLINILFLPKAVSHATVILPQTGQSNSYDANIPPRDDGALKQGVAWPSTRFVDNGDGTVTDHLTGLMWAKNANLPNGAKTWQQSLEYIANMNSGSGTFGYNDWRLPNYNEFQSIVDFGKHNPCLPQGNPFTNVHVSWYWASTTYAGDVNQAFCAHMNYGLLYYYAKSNNFYVWPVRSGNCGSLPDAIICLPKTGQTTSYYAGDDGAVQAGAAWPSPRFVDNADGTVTDQLTGLMWAKNANLPDGGKTWQQSLDYIVSMNSGSGTYGYNDWRLPNINEMKSMSDYGRSSPSLPDGHPFINAQANYYWSSTLFAGSVEEALSINVDTGKLDSRYQWRTQYVWPVRAGVGSSADLIVSQQGDGTGTVISMPAGIDCGEICRALFPMNEIVTMTAEPGPLSVFTGWSGSCSGTDPCTVTMGTSKFVSAQFSIISTTTIEPSTTTTAVVSTTTSTALDTDGDGITDDVDNCLTVCNPQQLDGDSDGLGDLCDPTSGCGGGCGQPACEQPCPATTTTEPATSSTTTSLEPSTSTTAAVSTTTSTALDTDGDGITDDVDNCLTVCNPQQSDGDNDGLGDLCDPTSGCGGGCGQPACEQPCPASTTTL